MNRNRSLVQLSAEIGIPASWAVAGKTEVTSVLGSEALGALSAPSTPAPVRQEIERRAIEGGDTSVAEIARLKADRHGEMQAGAPEVWSTVWNRNPGCAEI